MTRTRELLAAAAFAAISSTDLASAQGPPIDTDTPIMLGLQGRGTRTSVKVVRRSRLLENGQEVDDPRERRATVTVMPVALPYNILSDKLQIGLVAPFMNVDLSTTQSEASNGGIGDVQLNQYGHMNRPFPLVEKRKPAHIMWKRAWATSNRKLAAQCPDLIDAKSRVFPCYLVPGARLPAVAPARSQAKAETHTRGHLRGF